MRTRGPRKCATDLVTEYQHKEERASSPETVALVDAWLAPGTAAITVWRTSFPFHSTRWRGPWVPRRTAFPRSGAGLRGARWVVGRNGSGRRSSTTRTSRPRSCERRASTSRSGDGRVRLLATRGRRAGDRHAPGLPGLPRERRSGRRLGRRGEGHDRARAQAHDPIRRKSLDRGRLARSRCRLVGRLRLRRHERLPALPPVRLAGERSRGLDADLVRGLPLQALPGGALRRVRPRRLLREARRRAERAGVVVLRRRARATRRVALGRGGNARPVVLVLRSERVRTSDGVRGGGPLSHAPDRRRRGGARLASLVAARVAAPARHPDRSYRSSARDLRGSARRALRTAHGHAGSRRRAFVPADSADGNGRGRGGGPE